MFTIALCDDNNKEMQTILNLLIKFKNTHPAIKLSIQQYDSSDKLLDSLNAGKAYDLFLLNAKMPGIAGMELPRIINEKSCGAPLVFLISKADSMLPANKDFFILPIPEGIRKIPVTEIVYVEITDHVMGVRLVNGNLLLSKSIKVPFQTAAAPLFKDSRFLYAHKSYLINMEHIQELRGRNFIMLGNYIIPIPKSKIAEAKEKYYGYLSRFGFSRL